MEERRRWGVRQKLRWSIGTVMAIIAVVAIVLAWIRPKGPSIQARLATQIIEGQFPGFQANQYRVVDEVKSRDGRYWRVRFRGVGGRVKGDELTATVPDSRVQAADGKERR